MLISQNQDWISILLLHGTPPVEWYTHKNYQNLLKICYKINRKFDEIPHINSSDIVIFEVMTNAAYQCHPLNDAYEILFNIDLCQVQTENEFFLTFCAFVVEI